MPDLAVSNHTEIIAEVLKNSGDIDDFQSSHLWGTDSRVRALRALSGLEIRGLTNSCRTSEMIAGTSLYPRDASKFPYVSEWRRNLTKKTTAWSRTGCPDDFFLIF